MQIISLNRGSLPVNLVAFDQLAKVVHGAVLIWIKSTEPRKRKKTTNKNTRGLYHRKYKHKYEYIFNRCDPYIYEGEEGEQIQTERDVQSR